MDFGSDTSFRSTSTTRDSTSLAVPQPAGLGGALSPAVVRGLRTVLTAVIALSIGVALVWWLKAGTEETRQAFQAPSSLAPVPGAAVLDRASWARRNDLGRPAESGRVH